MSKQQSEKSQERLEKCDTDKYKHVLENGTTSEQYKMAECLISGFGYSNKKISLMAEKLYKTAADNGHVNASYMIYTLYAMKNKQSGVKYLKFAAENGHKIAKRMLMRCYLYGDAICNKEYAPQKAVEMLKEYVKTDDAIAYNLLAECYEFGKGTPIDLKMAKIFYNKETTKILRDYNIERVNMVMQERTNPSKKLRDEIVAKYKDIYQIVDNKLVFINKRL